MFRHVFQDVRSVFVPILLAFVLTYTTWAWGGLRPSFHVVGVCVAMALCVGLIVAGNRASRIALLRDPLTWIGLLFLGYLALQWHNAGRLQYYDVGHDRWDYMSPKYQCLPWAFAKADAHQMLAWFFPAWVIALAVRSPLMPSHSVHRLLLFLVYGSGLLSLFGLVQFASGTRSQYWTVPMDCHFFASFGYQNHASAYFVLVGAVAAGLLYREVFRIDRPFDRTRTTVLSLALLLCMVGANLALSRAGVILAWLFACFVVGYGIVRGWRRLPPVGRLNLSVVAAASLCILYFAVAGFGDREISMEFKWNKPLHHRLLPVLDEVNLGLGERPMFDHAAFRMWQDHPWFGVGGWGFKYLVADYIPQDQKARFGANTTGWANVHFDGLQFLLEFGLVGFALLACATAILVCDLFRHGGTYSALWVMGSIGLLLVVAISTIDLPFRCPAVLCTWTAVLAALPKLTQRTLSAREP